MVRLVIITLLVCFSHKLLGQNNKINAGKFEISIGGGAVIPVGKFASTSTTGFEQTVFEKGSDQQYDIGFFSKENHGHAKRGGDMNLEINFLTRRFWVHGLSIGQSSNAVRLELANNYFSNVQGPAELRFHEDFNLQNISYQLGYRFKPNNGSFEFRPFQRVGFSQLTFPFYILESINFPGVTVIHEGDRPRLNSLYFETGILSTILLSKKFDLGFNLSYRFADFDYIMYQRIVPGGSTTLIVPDQVNFRAIMTGFRLAYKL
ncbi:hypothetical protein P872_05935 [Rhodonellum psychrophilum GCM71 = DSM 17998]|uniref:Outer membrane protein beta-barrel domain-containing protein n=2 Tax=Rhodonellum TaxID=336827 RepID=U5BXG5_9BACT|nr:MULTISPECIES: hypothetical protein [Rhodonellum]ERM82563.1 hypothetical protein P872_05935 [Rhodonellum psychrophilum GCM71 = DSM 17998]SDY53521.1 hypothetical protein SAMN05444412_101454 [Rhodonellum ikkaensis]